MKKTTLEHEFLKNIPPIKGTQILDSAIDVLENDNLQLSEMLDESSPAGKQDCLARIADNYRAIAILKEKQA